MEVAEILDAVRIEDYVGQYIDEDFEERGGELWCRSPFKPEERTPSFSIRTEDNIFYDYCTAKGGNVLNFIMQYDGVDFHEALRRLKKFAHIEDDGTWVTTRLATTRIAKRFAKLENRKTKACTAKPMPESCMDRYVFDRRRLEPWFDEGISWEAMMYFSVRYDAVDNRIVYPIRNYDGEIISVCGRTCDPDFKEKHLRKYTYYGEVGTIDTLCCFAENKEEILASKQIVLFEGFKSCAKAWGWGIRNTAAILTSHVSPNQLMFLIGLSCNYGVDIVFALDSDVDITKDEQIMKLKSYANVSWVCNRDEKLDPKDAPVDKGEAVFRDLFERRRPL